MSWSRRGFFQKFSLFLAWVQSGRSAPRPETEGPGTPASPPQELPATGLPASPPARSPRAGGYIRPGTIEVVHRSFDLVVVGGGISGTCTAISAARNGLQTALVHERSMLGGNSSSEVRLFPENTSGQSTWIKESGIHEELHLEERTRNHEPYIEGLMNCHWDLVLYDWCVREKNLTLLLNASMRQVEMKDPGHILAIHAVQLGTEKDFVLEAPLFVDATGDGVLGYRAGAEFRWGKEARGEYGEPLAPEKASEAVMGNTLFFRARNAGKPIPFRPPQWAVEFASESDLTARSHTFIDGGYWWIEVGHPRHPIRDNEEIRHEALRQLLGLWDHIKNRCEHRDQARDYGLEFVGFWPYKRESRRLIGDHVLRQEDVQDPKVHPDDIAYGCWGIDIHVPGGIEMRKVAPYPPPSRDENWESYGTLPYGIPLRCCYSRNIRNLLMAGRPISASYVAFASSRVLPTGAMVGQGVGAAAVLCKKYNCEPRTVGEKYGPELQQLLLRQDCHIPGVENSDPGDLGRDSHVTAGSEARLVFPDAESFYELKYPAAQLFPLSSSRLQAVELHLRSAVPHPVPVRLGLRKAEHVWDFRSTRDLATATATVAPGSNGYVRFALDTPVEPGRLYYVHLPAAPGISWGQFRDKPGEPSAIPAGTSAADIPGRARWRPLTGGRCFFLRVTPEQRPYGPQNVARGTHRPDRWTNIYISDPAQGLPAWVELRFPRAVRFNRVELAFDTNVNRREILPLFHYPDCVKQYEISVWNGNSWHLVAQQDGNYFRRRIHDFEPVTSEGLRIHILETNGAQSARLYEVRVYDENGRGPVLGVRPTQKLRREE